jgi:STE24 endopeptidase
MSLDRRAAWLTAGVSAVVFVVLAAVLVPWDWVPGGSLRPAEPLDVFTAEQVARAQEYASVRRYLGWASYAVSLLVAGVLGFTTLGSRLLRRVLGDRRWWLVVPAGVLVLLVIGRVTTLPFSVLIRQRNLDYGLTEQTWAAWAVDYGKALLVSWVLTSLVLLVLVLAARRSPRRWFLWAGGAAAGLTMAGSFLYPVLLEPVFNEFEPLAEGPLRTSVFELAERQGVEIDDVLVADASRRTTTLNAYVSGFGTTRRVVLYDNLVEELPRDEASVVIAHELAHAKHRDVVLGTTLGAVGALFGVTLLALALDSPRLRRRAGVTGPADPYAVPLVLALAAVAILAVSPVENTISRAIEVRADRESLAATGESDTFVSMQRELALASLSDPTPPRWSHLWFGSHPTVLQRAGLPASLESAEGTP